jgi:phosphoenolpyruvate-protein kinase (PTS system EI component)
VGAGQIPAGSALRHQGVEEEMNRFHGALRRARHELRDARRGLLGPDAEDLHRMFGEEDALLRDSLVLLEVERTILDERWSTEEALKKVLDERRRLARLVGERLALLEIACLERAFERVVCALELRSSPRALPENGKGHSRR